MITIEFYADTLHTALIGAVDVPAKRVMESAETLGKAVCRVRKLNVVECVMIDENGNSVDQCFIFR